MNLRRSLLLLLTLLGLAVHAEPTIQKSVDLDAYKGKVVYLDFWASWCKPCRRSFPWMNEMQEKYAGDLVVLAINVDKEPQLADRFLQEIPANFRIYFDQDGEWPSKMKIKGMPSSLMIDRNGEIKYRHTGFFDEKRKLYEQELQTLLKAEGV